MATIEWDQDGQRLYETGIDRVVLYKKDTASSSGEYGVGVGWNGFTGVTESPSGAEETAIFANNRKYGSLYSNEEFAGTLNAYTYPDEWEECDGSAELVDGVSGVTVAQQTRVPFGFTYRTLVGNDVLGNDYGYNIHLVYGATASPSSKDYQSINDSPETVEFSWDFKTVPVDVPGHRPSSRITINSKKVDDAVLKALEATLYGTENTDPRLPLPAEVISLLNNGGSGVTGETGSTGSTGNTGN